MRPRSALWVGLALLLAAAARAQPQVPPQFHAGTDVVAVDFYAIDKDGNPVLGL